MKYKPLITAAIVTIIIGSYCFFSDNEKCEKERKIFISKESSIKTAFCKNFNGKCYANYGFYARPALKRKQQLMIQI
ncbi:hypothetical protein HOG21_03555 [bacterium]|nr:hypothetical protein [bacterium]